MLGVDLTACWRPRVGMVTVAVELTRALAARGVPLLIFCSRQRVPGFEGHPAVISTHRHELANKLLWLPAVEADAGVDAMLYPYWPPPPRRRRNAPPALTFVHDLAFRIRPDEVPWQQRLYLGSLLPGALRKSAAVLVPSMTTRDDVVREFPVPGLEDRVTVVGEGAPELPAGASLPGGLQPGFVLAVGTVEPRKNYDRLLEAYRAVRRRVGDAPPLVIAGRVGWNVDGLPERLRAEPGVVHLAEVDDAALGSLYEHAGVLAFPSLYEGFGLPLLEAMTFGVPAVIGRAGALPELAGGAALEVDPEDIGALASALERALTDETLRTQLSERGRRRAAEFSWDAAAARVEDVLGKLTPPR
ncbi:MAG TPA: glycosyltransferase family 1 protein [Candidatus Dormibacteraeota bacterium]